MSEISFAGDKKQGEWVFAQAERRMVNWLVPMVPRFIETYHLTLMTLIWSLGIAVAGFLARGNLHWLWLVSFFIFLQYVSDVLDGAVGRYRDTGLVKWGYYMDHFLDYVFLSSVIVVYGLVLPDLHWLWFYGLIVLGGAFMVNTFLAFAATNELRISVLKFGPTEARLFFIVVNTAIILFGAGWARILVPVVTLSLTTLLIYLVIRTQKNIWSIDMELKSQVIRETDT